MFQQGPLNLATKDALMYEVILYAAIATVVCVMFYSVLGKTVGKGPEDAINPRSMMEDDEKKASVIEPLSSEMEKKGLGAIAARDPEFSPSQFIDGAKQAYSMILEAFAAGDEETLANLLTIDTLEVYKEAIKEREEAGYTQVTDLGRLKKASIDTAELNGLTARISVLYESDLTSALMDEDGNVVQGDPDVLSSISEIWSFERNLKESDPTWRLADVTPSEGDDLEADPSPDTKEPDPKTSATKTAGKKPSAKKASGKKTATKKAPTKKTSGKKTATKKSSGKKPSNDS